MDVIPAMSALGVLVSAAPEDPGAARAEAIRELCPPPPDVAWTFVGYPMDLPDLRRVRGSRDPAAIARWRALVHGAAVGRTGIRPEVLVELSYLDCLSGDFAQAGKWVRTAETFLYDQPYLRLAVRRWRQALEESHR